MRAVSQIAGVSINTVSKLLIEAGQACAAHHDETVREVHTRRVQCDEIWSFCYAKEKNVARAEAASEGAADVWTWTAIDSDSKMILSYEVGDFYRRDGYRVHGRSSGAAGEPGPAHHGRPQSVSGSRSMRFSRVDVDYAMLVKLYGSLDAGKSAARRYSPAECTGIIKRKIEVNPDPAAVSTSYVVRSNLTMRMGMRRFTRLTNAFSKKIENHLHMLALYFCHYNFVRIHKTLKVTPAMAAGVDSRLREMAWIVSLIDARAPKPSRPKSYCKKQVSN